MARFRLAAALLSAALPALGAAAAHPVRVCDVLRKPEEYAGKAMLVLGRLSSRESGRFLGEERCSDQGKPVLLELHPDRQAGPLPDGSIDVDRAAVEHDIAEMKKSTALHTFPFGSGEYDRWAIVYGRVEIPTANTKPASDRYAGKIVLRSDSLVIFLNDQ
ncbi:MAG TPA: hypothetical protein VFA04_13470 [Bryobacteraceae bacterium]|nr:hypothetical protein [Bryobacteraceae bacterium]